MNQEPRALTVRTRIRDAQGFGFDANVLLTRSADHLKTIIAVDRSSKQAEVSVKHDRSLAAFFLDLDPRALEEQLGEGRRSADYVRSKLYWIERYLDEGNVGDARRIIAALQDVFADTDT